MIKCFIKCLDKTSREEHFILKIPTKPLPPLLSLLCNRWKALETVRPARVQNWPTDQPTDKLPFQSPPTFVSLRGSTPLFKTDKVNHISCASFKPFNIPIMTPHPTPLLSFWTLGYYWGKLILSQHRLCGRGGGEGEGPLSSLMNSESHRPI